MKLLWLGGVHPAQTPGNNHSQTLSTMITLGALYLYERSDKQSETVLREALKNFEKSTTPDAWRRFNIESLLGASLAAQKRYAEAEPLLLEGYSGMLARKSRMSVSERYHLDRAREWLVRLYEHWGKPSKAAEWRDNALASMAVPAKE